MRLSYAREDIVSTGQSLAVIKAGISVTINNANHKLTISMKATKATNIQIRLLVEESQQLNSRK